MKKSSEQFNINKIVEEQEGAVSPKISRRNFLKKALVTGATVAGAISGVEPILDIISIKDDNLEEIKEKVLEKVGVEDDLVENESEIKKREDILDAEIEGVSDKAKDVAREFRNIFEKVIGDEEFTPKNLLNDDFYMAIQLRETKYDNNKVSSKGAVGVMQNTAISIEDLIRVMQLTKERFKYKGERIEEKKEAPRLAKEMLKIVQSDRTGDFSRIFGKLYLMVLYNEYNIGRDARNSEDALNAQERIASCYNGGVTQGKKSRDHWHKESKEYARIVKKYTKRLGEISAIMKDRQVLGGGSPIITNDNQTRMLIARRLAVMQHGAENMLKEYIKTIKALENKNKRSLSKNEIENILKKSQNELRKIRS